MGEGLMEEFGTVEEKNLGAAVSFCKHDKMLHNGSFIL